MRRVFVSSLMVSLLLLVAACDGGLTEELGVAVEVAPAATAAPAAVPAAATLPPSITGATPAATPAPAAPRLPTPAPTPTPGVVPPQAASARPGGGVQPAPLPQNRVIVRTARISLVVGDIAGTVNRIVGVAQRLGGWVVSSDRTSEHSGSIAIRVPAESLDEAFRQVETLALEVESRAVTSEDVTDEYVDNQSRLTSMRATELRLLSFLEQAEDVEDALAVQSELSRLQQQIEQTQGRLNFLEQTAAYSLIEVSLKLTSQTLAVDAGGDMSVRVGHVARFRASFTAPEDIDDFTFSWDFGDGNSTSGSGSVLRPEGHRVTATVNHVYEYDRDSPYIVSVELRGTGPGGIAEGSDSIEVAVQEVPTIDVFAGENLTVEEGDEVDYTASFTHPAELRDYEYKWNFGDGSPTVIGVPDEGSTRLQATHSFRDYRTRPYDVTLTVTAMSDAGEVTGSGSFSVRVTESEGLLVWGWDIGETAGWAVRVLVGIAWVITTVAIWVGILSPVIIGLIVLIFLIRRFGPRLDLGGGGKRAGRPARHGPWDEQPAPADGDPPSTG